MEELYNQLYKDGKYTKTFEDFQAQFGTPEKSEKLYTVLNQAGDYTKSFSDFQTQFSITGKTTPTTPDAVVEETAASNQNQDTESKSDRGFLGFNEIIEAGVQGGKSGFLTAQATDETLAIFAKLGDAEKYEYDDFVNAVNKYKEAGNIDELNKWSNTYDKYKQEGNNAVMSTILAIKDEGIAGFSGVLVQSLAGLMSKEAVGTGVAGATTLAGATALAGQAGPQVALPEELVTVPTAAIGGFMAGMNAMAETTVTFAGNIQEELQKKGLEFTAENVKTLMQDDEIATSIRNKSLARGLTIGAIEGVFTALGGKAFSSTGRAVKAATKSTRLSKVAGTTAAGITEAAGGSLGEAAGLTIEGKPLDAKEIIIEGIAGIGGAPVSIATQAPGLIKGNKYIINGKETTFEKAEEIINSATGAQLAGMQIEIKGDEEFKNFARQKQEDERLKANIDTRITDQEDRNQVFELEKEFKKFQKLDSESGKLRAKEIREEIAEISAKYKRKGRRTTESAQLEQQRIDVEKATEQRSVASTVAFAERVGGKLNAETITADNNDSFKKLMDEEGIAESEYESRIDLVGGYYSPKTNKIYINKEAAAKTGQINVGAHEALHGILFAKVGSDANQGALVKKFESQLDSNQQAKMNELLASRYGDKDVKATEYLTVFSDAIVDGDIKFNETIFTKIGDVIKSILRAVGYSKINFESGKGVYDFMREYNKSIKKGDLTKAAEKALGIIPGGAKQTTQQGTFSKAQLEKTKERLNRIPVKEIRSSNAINSIAMELPNMISTQLRNRFANIDPNTLEEFVSDVQLRMFTPNKEGVQKDLNWDGRGDLYGFLNGRIGLRIKDAVKQDYKRQPGERMYVGRIESTELENIATEVTVEPETTTSTAKAPEKPQFKQLKDSNVASDVVLKNIETSLTRILSLLKNRIDAPISKNRTITPIISEIKKEVDKVIVGILKSEMGGLPGAKFENYLKTRKKAILENSTTTWLMGKDKGNKVEGGIPQAIEKSVDGKFLKYPDWVGKKIDRETVETDQAGRTSGAELSRRVKNVDRYVSDEMLLSQFFNEDGTLIRGRKEALEKHLVEELSFEIISDQMANPESAIYKALAGNQERLGYAIAENAAVEVKKQVERGNVKFSLSPKEQKIIKNSTDAAAGLTESFAINYYNKIIRTGIDSKEYQDFKLAQSKLHNIPLQILNVFEDKLVYEGVIAEMQSLRNKNKGIRYERALEKTLKKLYGKNVLVKRVGSIKGDLEIKVGNKKLLIELKLNKNAQISSMSLRGLFVDGKFNPNFTLSKDTSINDAIIKNVKNKEYFENFLNALKEAAKELNVEIQFTSSGNIVLPKKGYKVLWELARTKMPNQIYDSISNESDQNALLDLYEGVDLIHFGDSGLFKIKPSALTNGIPDLQATVNYKVRADRSGNRVSFRVLPVITELKSQSEYSLENSTGINKITENANPSSFSLADRAKKMIEQTSDIDSKAEISEKKANLLSKNKGKFKFFIPPSADDFMGLMYYMVGKGKQGDADLAWIKKNLADPFAQGINDFTAYRQGVMQQFRKFKKVLRKSNISLKSKNSTGFTNETAVRVYIWATRGMDIPGLTREEIVELTRIVSEDSSLRNFAKQIMNLTAFAENPAPENSWDAGTITTDILDYLNTSSREKFLSQYLTNAEEIFGKFGQSGKIEGSMADRLRAAYGENYIEALSDVLYRMKTGRRRASGANKLTNQFVNWVNDSVGAIMFFNTRSAVLQQLSFINFINFGDNNPINASKAFSNQKQFWADYSFLFNSDFLKERRSGLKTDVNADEIAQAAEEGRNPIRSVIASILKKGFLPTQIADSHAISLGGASFYRNRINTYLKQGLSQTEAKQKAFLDFQEAAEESQQSSRPDRISMQQASGLGRLVLAFANTPMQYARLTKKAALDLINRRGDWKTNTSKLIYYGAVQNIMFSTLQSAMFALAFDDEEEDKVKDKYFRVGNSVADSFLRGLGFGGAAVSTVKNMVLEAIKQANKDRPDYERVAIKALSLSPPVDSKIRKLMSAGRTFSYRNTREKMAKEGFSLDNPAFEAVGQAISATTNLPADRVIRKLDNLSTPIRQDVETWQAIAIALGWSKWDVGLIDNSTPKPKAKTTGLKKKKLKRKKLK